MLTNSFLQVLWTSFVDMLNDLIVFPGEVPKDQRQLEAAGMVAFDRPPVIERLQGNVGKRKSTTPQKFVGKCHLSSKCGWIYCMQHTDLQSSSVANERRQVTWQETFSISQIKSLYCMCTVQNGCAVCVVLNQVTTHSRPKWASELGPKMLKRKLVSSAYFWLFLFHCLIVIS